MIRRRPRAIEAIIAHAEYIGRRSPASAERFLVATEATFSRLEQMPRIGRRYESRRVALAGIRVWSVKGFPNHLIYYRPHRDGIDILQFLHGTRDLHVVLRYAVQRGEI